MNEFDITVVAPRGLSSQSLSNLLAWLPSREHEPLHKDLSGEEIYSVKIEEWRIVFDGSSTHLEGGAAVLLYASTSPISPLPSKLELSRTNNEVRYESLIIGLIFALKRGVFGLRTAGPKLIIKQVNDEFALKKISIIPYRTTVQRLVKPFENIQF